MHAVLEIIKACCLKVLQRHESLNICIYMKRGLLGGTVVKNPSANAGTQVRSLGWEDLLEKEMATHSSILSYLENPTDGGAWWATVHGVTKSRTRLSN